MSHASSSIARLGLGLPARARAGRPARGRLTAKLARPAGPGLRAREDGATDQASRSFPPRSS